MPTKRCHHCGENVEVGAPHDCWTTTPEALTRPLPEHLQEAWERLRETAEEFGEQRIYASHKSIMFSRKACYFFVRPRTKDLEVCFFLGREVKAPQIRSSANSSRLKVYHLVRIVHRDEVEAPLTDWLREAYEVSDSLSGRAAAKADKPAARSKAGKAAKSVRGSKRAKAAKTPKPARKRPPRRQKKR